MYYNGHEFAIHFLRAIRAISVALYHDPPVTQYKIMELFLNDEETDDTYTLNPKEWFEELFNERYNKTLPIEIMDVIGAFTLNSGRSYTLDEMKPLTERMQIRVPGQLSFDRRLLSFAVSFTRIASLQVILINGEDGSSLLKSVVIIHVTSTSLCLSVHLKRIVDQEQIAWIDCITYYCLDGAKNPNEELSNLWKSDEVEEPYEASEFLAHYFPNADFDFNVLSESSEEALDEICGSTSEEGKQCITLNALKNCILEVFQYNSESCPDFMQRILGEKFRNEILFGSYYDALRTRNQTNEISCATKPLTGL